MTDNHTWLGVDVGGTFTDLAYMDGGGRLHCIKVPSTPRAPAQAALRGIEELLAAGIMERGELERLIHIHGSTVAVNTLIERRGARLGALVTTGFRDLFEMGRMAIPRPAVFTSRRTPPLVPRRRVAEIAGRLDKNGKELTPIDEAEVIEKSAALIDAGAEAITVCLLHSYLNPAHELAVRDIIRRHFDGLVVECSAEVWPQAREFERGILACINAYVRPAVESYLAELVAGTSALGIAMEPQVTRSNGGCQRATSIRQHPSAALLSGTASGLVAVAGLARDLDMPEADLVTVDIGGTSADIGVIRGGSPVLSAEEHVAGLPVLLPTVAVSSIGAGGGSLLSIDADGIIAVGPNSAGADPGPACYDRGGTRPTLTDAVAVCGWLPSSQPLGGRIAVRGDLARAAIASLADAHGLSAEQLADGAVAIAVAMMAAEMTSVIARRGVDAPDFSLVPFGGAGPLFGALLAEEVHIGRVIVPPHAGALSAIGALRSNVEGDLIEAVYCHAGRGLGAALARARAALQQRARHWLRSESAVPHGTAAMSYSAEMRYAGQSFEISVELATADVESLDETTIVGRFHAAYESIYGRADYSAAVFMKELRMHMVLPLPERRVADRAETTVAGPPRRDSIWLRGKRVEADFFAREAVPADATIAGPAVISQADTTILVPDGWTARSRRSAALLLECR